MSNSSDDKNAKLDPDQTGAAGFASPACYAHEVDPAYLSAVPPIARGDLIEIGRASCRERVYI